MPILPKPTQKTQRALAGAVAVLLTGNALAVATLATDDDDLPGLRRATEGGAAEVAPPPAPELALITASDGRTFVADPSTVAGRRAIDQARKDGATVRTVPRPAPKGTTTTTKKKTTTTTAGPAARQPGTTLLPSLDDVLGQLPDVCRLASGVCEIAGGGGPSTTIPGGATPTTLLPPEVSGPVTSILNQVPVVGPTVNSVVGSTQSTVLPVLGGAQSTVTSVVNQTPLAPVNGLLGQVVTTVSSVVQGATTPTTTAPSGGSGGSGGICGLLTLSC